MKIALELALELALAHYRRLRRERRRWGFGLAVLRLRRPDY